MKNSPSIRPLGCRNHYLASKSVSAGAVPGWWLVCLLLTGLSNVGWGQCFNATAVPSGGNFPHSVALGDFNSDGRADLATPNAGSNNVSVLLGNGSGGFGAPTSFAVGDDPESIATGDFNSDGRADLAVANVRSNNVSVLLGNGTGGFGAATNFAVGIGPQSVAVGDFNGDGRPDLAVAILNSDYVSVLLGIGSGNFSAPTNFSVGMKPYAAVVGDFNGDGRADLVTPNSGSNNVSVLLGTGSGGFGAATNFPVGSDPTSVAVGDFNGDGRPDLATANFNGNDVSVLLGNGSGGFGAPTKFPIGSFSYSVALGDFNGDGRTDLAVVKTGSGSVAVLLGTGSGGFGAPTNFAVGVDPFQVVVGNFNGDGRPDLATANINSNNLSILLNCAPPASFAIASVTPVHCTTVTATERQFTFTPQYAGLNGQPVSFSVINEMLPTTNPGPYTLRLYTDNPIIRLRATQGGTPGEASVDYNWLAVCQAGFTPPAPFGITGVTSVNCTAVTATERRLTFTPQYTGVSGQPISFSIINEMLPTTNPGPYTLRLYTDNPIIRLRATQSGTSGEASFNYNWLANCMGLGVARLGTSPEPTARLQVKLLGNPVHYAVEVEVTGSENTTLQLSLTDLKGHIVDQRRTEQAGASEHYLFDVSKLPTGSLLLRTSNQGQSQTVRILKVN
ncbi:T9SS type A sorting domain-containing protein [Spirosoma luteum]|uniref:T9SS type A sorting domain-containing protein n=1 Tax=Spirosoma luteum TaxID=431553 RepID=UPI0012F727CE|nr:T9SS type A sorting domain-containing protein [Spirosoma luteum]